MMIPAGYMLKLIGTDASWLKKAVVTDVRAVKSEISKDFADYIKFWKHNGWWFFDNPETLLELAKAEETDLQALSLFYYEVFELQYEEDIKAWKPFEPESFETRVDLPKLAKLDGYDIVSFAEQTDPECSPLFDCSIADDVKVNQHCLLESFEEAKFLLEEGTFDHAVPGPYRIFAVYSIPLL